MTKPQAGFTLWELLMTLLVAGILLGIGVPNMMEFQRNSAMSAAANDFVTAVLAARTEAIKRQVPVTLCLSDDPLAATPVCQTGAATDSTRGFVVFVDENDNRVDGIPNLGDPTDGNAAFDAGAGETEVLRRTAAPGGSIRLSTNCGYVTFGPTGMPQRAGALCFPFTSGTPWSAFLFCDDRGRRIAAGGLSAARIVRIDRFGRGQVLQELDGPNGTGITNTIAGTLVPAGVSPTCP
jgi:prepilin-type N-terminal cleavage/methylation domain-containing protein